MKKLKVVILILILTILVNTSVFAVYKNLTIGTNKLYFTVNISNAETIFYKQADVNPPVIPSTTGNLSTIEGNGICAVMYDDSGTKSIVTDLSQAWYNYTIQTTDTASGGTSKWANIETIDGSLWVWIPRFAYKITNYHKNTEGTVEIKFLRENTNEFYDGTGTAEIDPANITYTTDGTQNEWYVHPAFTFGTTQLTGFWVAKYEASVVEPFPVTTSGTQNITNKNVSGTKTVQIKPNQECWNYIDLSNSFVNCFLMGREKAGTYGFKQNTNTHLIKNMEWGASALLAQSNYGRNGTIITKNDTLISGSAGALSSTTGNYYGIFDMVGGGEDEVSAYQTAATTAGSNNPAINFATYLSTVENPSAYYEVYPSYTLDNLQKGDCIWETSSAPSSNNAWQAGTSWFLQNTASGENRMTRGGSTRKTTAGIFSFDRYQLVWYQVNKITFRPTITNN